MPRRLSAQTLTAGEPLIIRRGDLQAKLSVKDVLSALRKGFAGLAKGSVIQPPQVLMVFPEGRGDVVAYLGVLSDADSFGVKLSPYFVCHQNGPQVTAWTLLMSMSTGKPRLLCDSLDLTIERTAGTTMLAVEYLMKAEAKRLAIFGIGRLGLAHLRYALAMRDWDRVLLFSRALMNDPALLKKIPPDMRGRVAIAKSAEHAVRESDVVLLCTSSAQPVIDHRWLERGVLVTSISTNAPNAHEIPPEGLLTCEVFCEYRATTAQTAGEMILAARDHAWSPAVILADLPELIAGGGKRPTGRSPVFFRSVGLGVEDLAIANLVLSRASNNGAHNSA